MIYFIFILEFVLLFIFSRNLINGLGTLFFKLTGNRRLTVYFIFIVFFPGIVVHEFLHAIAAWLVFVKVRNIEIFPRVAKDEVILGHVEMEKSDVLRRSLIGVAPFVGGAGLIMSSLLYFLSLVSDAGNSLMLSILFLFIVFEITNTMFSSKKDLEGIRGLFIFLLLILIIIYLAGISLPFDVVMGVVFSDKMVSFVKTMNFLLIVPLALNFVLFLIVRLLSKVQ